MSSIHGEWSPARRRWSAGLGAAVLAVTAASFGLAAAPAALAQGQPEQLRIGYQKSAGLFVLQKSLGTLERKLAPQSVSVKWVEFPAGPQLLEGLNVGSIDVGFVGEAPPIFAQAAGANFVYIGNDPPSPRSEALVVPKDSAVRSVADLKGKRIALNKGSNVHYLLVKLLEKHGLAYADVQPVFLAPADARAAFERGAVDAWAIWDPFLAAAEKQIGARVLADGREVVNNYQFYLGERAYAQKYPQVIDTLFADLREQGRWLVANLREGAGKIAPLQGLDVEIVEQSLRRVSLDVAPVTPAVAAEQQKIADAFHELKLIPKPIRITDALPAPARTAQN